MSQFVGSIRDTHYSIIKATIATDEQTYMQQVSIFVGFSFIDFNSNLLSIQHAQASVYGDNITQNSEPNLVMEHPLAINDSSVPIHNEQIGQQTMAIFTSLICERDSATRISIVNFHVTDWTDIVMFTYPLVTTFIIATILHIESVTLSDIQCRIWKTSDVQQQEEPSPIQVKERSLTCEFIY